MGTQVEVNASKTELNANASETLSSAVRKRKTPLHVKDFAEANGVSIKSVYTGVRQGLIPHRRVLGRIVFDPHTTADWMESLDIP
jgi:hypothetical protein